MQKPTCTQGENDERGLVEPLGLGSAEVTNKRLSVKDVEIIAEASDSENPQQ